jgi:RNA polymerase sigma-70 factor, ECF subfamily
LQIRIESGATEIKRPKIMRLPMTQSIEQTGVVESDNARIVSGLQVQSPELLHELIDVYQHRLMRYLTHLTGRKDEAEDLFQEVWLRVLRSGSSYNGTAPFDSWLFTIARNLFFDLKRRHRPVVSLEEMNQTEDGLSLFEVAEGRPSPLEQFQTLEDAESLNRAIVTLSAEQREVLRLRYQEELALNEIAFLTHASLSTVKSRVYRAVAALKSQLQKFR